MVEGCEPLMVGFSKKLDVEVVCESVKEETPLHIIEVSEC